jgi:hypothetical protein
LFEFLKVNEAAARSTFLKAEGIEVFNWSQLLGASTESTVAFRSTFNSIVAQQGRADAGLAAAARATGIESVTMDGRLYNYVTLTLKDTRLPMTNSTG